MNMYYYRLYKLSICIYIYYIHIYTYYILFSANKLVSLQLQLSAVQLISTATVVSGGCKHKSVGATIHMQS